MSNYISLKIGNRYVNTTPQHAKNADALKYLIHGGSVSDGSVLIQDDTNSNLDDTNSNLDDTNSNLDDTNSNLDDTNSNLDDTNSVPLTNAVQVVNDCSYGRRGCSRNR